MYLAYAALTLCAGATAAIGIIKATKTNGWRWRATITAAAILAFQIVLAAGYGEWSLPEILTGYVTAFFMLWLAVTDVKSFTLPNKVLLAWLVCRIILMIATALMEQSLNIIIGSVAGALITGLLFLAVYYLSKRTLGGGDVKLSFVLGLSLTLERVFGAVFYGLVFCAVFSLAGMMLKRLKRKDFIPLGPFLFLGMVVAYLFQIGGWF